MKSTFTFNHQMGSILGLLNTPSDRVAVRDGARLNFMKPGLIEETSATKNLVISEYDKDQLCQQLRSLDPQNYLMMCRLLNSREVLNSTPHNFKTISFVDRDARCLVKVTNQSRSYDSYVFALVVD
jgi:hypothetical protein